MVWVNLLSWRQAQLNTARRRWILGASLLLALGMTAAAFVQGQQQVNRQQQQVLSRLKESRTQLSEALAERENQRQQRQALLSALNKRQLTEAGLSGWYRFFTDFPAEMPEHLRLTDIQKKADRLMLSGQGEGMNAIEQFHLQMRRWPIFSQVEMAKISRDRQGQMHFILQAALRAPEESNE